ncbi:MAG: carbamoyltransferase N-terminal domain-containing protein [Alphaproteobacteria bacterium]
MKILSIGFGYLSTAALMIDSKIVSVVSEERFTKNKNEEGYPMQAINYCLKKNKIKGNDLDAIVIASNRLSPIPWITKNYSSFSIKDHVTAQQKYWYPRLNEGKNTNWFNIFKEKADFNIYPGGWKKIFNRNSNHHGKDIWPSVKKNIYFGIQNHLKISEDIIYHIEHHQCHAAYAYWASPFRDKKCLIFTADAYGDDLSATISIALNNKISRVKAIKHNLFFLGRIYRYTTLLLGMKPAEHEYKVMGLAPYAKKKYYNEALKIFENLLDVDGINFKWKYKPNNIYEFLRKEFEGHRFDNIAGALQEYTETLLSKWIKNSINKYKIDRIVFSGGVSMNIKANMKIHELKEVKEFFVCGSGGDESLPIGAAYEFNYKNNKNNKINFEMTPYLGKSYTNEEIYEWVEKNNFKKKYKVINKLNYEKIADFLAKGMILGRHSGPMEFGARSLGNRAILANPQNRSTIEIINKKIKNRDFWMPFAPSIISEDFKKYVVNPKKIYSPYMTMGFESTELAKKHLIAALHPADYTLRPQEQQLK